MAKSHSLSGNSLKLTPRRVRDVNKEHRDSFSTLDHAALWVTDHVGTMGFFLVVFVWTFGWLGWNTLAPIELRFDPFPAFVLWLFISNMIQIMLMPLIMIGQNLQGRHAELRAEADFQVNKRSEREIISIIDHLERQHETMLKVLKHLESNKKK
ncbi:MAG: DUF1003 domain-containing protein [Patescibacteria group bacterium]|jgi:uncharacterized membrane protein